MSEALGDRWRLSRWSSWLRDTIKANDRGRELLPGRAWELGSITWEGAKRKAFFMIGVHWPDGNPVARHAGAAGKPLVFVPCTVPEKVIARMVKSEIKGHFTDDARGLARAVACLADPQTRPARTATRRTWRNLSCRGIFPW